MRRIASGGKASTICDLLYTVKMTEMLISFCFQRITESDVQNQEPKGVCWYLWINLKPRVLKKARREVTWIKLFKLCASKCCGDRRSWGRGLAHPLCQQCTWASLETIELWVLLLLARCHLLLMHCCWLPLFLQQVKKWRAPSSPWCQAA